MHLYIFFHFLILRNRPSLILAAILMLMELIREESDISRAAIRRSRTPSKKEEELDEGIVGVQMMDNRDAFDIDTSTCEDDAHDARSVDEADIYKSAIDEGVSINSFYLACIISAHLARDFPSPFFVMFISILIAKNT